MLDYIYICNTSGDYISKVNLAEFKEESKIPLGMDKVIKNGPHDICLYKDKFLVANSYSNSLSIIDILNEEEVENYYIGIHCNGVRVYEDDAYIICGEINSLVVFNLVKKKIIEEIPCGIFPHSISINETKKIIAVANMHSDDLTLIDLSSRENIGNVGVAAYPTKVIFTEDNKYMIVCESEMGMSKRGTLSILDFSTMKCLKKIEVGNIPVDAFIEKEHCYISNFGDGTISIVDINHFKEVERIKIGGMPRGIVKNEKYIYAVDNYNNLLIRASLDRENKKVIAIGGEPTAMTLY